jgi:polar amino acid transport system substrate-binding protein
MKKLFILSVSVLVISGLWIVSCSSSSSTVAPAPIIPVQTNAAVSTAPAPTSTADSAKIIVATDATLPPFEYVDNQTKEIVGFDIDIMKAIAAKENLIIGFQIVNWAPLLAGMAQGTYDCAISSIPITEDRKKDMNFSDPYFPAGQIVVVNADNTDIKGKDTLKGKVGVQRNTNGDIEVQKIKAVAVIQYDKIGAAFQDLIDGQINAVVCDNPVAVIYVGKIPDKLKLAGGTFTNESYGIAVAKTRTDLLKKINSGLKTVKAEGMIEKASAKWFK